MWDVKGKSVEIADFEPFGPSTVLYDFDGPRIFTYKNRDDELFLAYHCGQDDTHWRFLLVPFTEKLVNQLEHGEISIREALSQPRAWLVDVDDDWQPVRAWKAALSAMPPKSLPAPNTMLLPSLEPLISLRAIGERVLEGEVPGSVISNVVEGVRRALKVLVEYVLENTALAARPSGTIRRLYDLPAQRLAFNSFEISFRRPLEGEQGHRLTLAKADHEQQDAILRQVGQLLQKGLAWASSPNQTASGIQGSDDERRAILQAIIMLSPPAVGLVRSMEIRGGWVNEITGAKKRVIRLERGIRRRIKEELNQMHADREEIVTPTGLIREADRDRYTFELREITDQAGPMRFTFDEEIAEDVLDAFQEEYRVKILGVRLTGAKVYEALRVERIEA